MMSKTRYILGRPCTPVLLLVPLAMIFAAGPHSAFGTTLKHRATSTGKRQHAPRRRKPAAQAHAAVIGGLSASAGSFPALAYITGATSEEEGFACTGTVVASNLILTAAHCAENVETDVVDEPADYTVVTGTVNRDAASRQVSTVSRVIVYPGFVPSLLYGDAALLVLTAPTTASTVPLWTAANAGTLQAGRAGEIVGWGQEYHEQEGLPLTLKWASTAIQSPVWCAQNATGFFEQGELCTIDPPSYSTGACHGDSGGPLLASSAEGPVEVGITSHIYGECLTNQPTVFARTDILVSWVHEWTEAEKPAPPVLPPTAPKAVAPTASPPAAGKAATPPTPTPAQPPAPRLEGVYRGTTTQASTPISLVVGSGGRRVTAIASKIVYACRSGRTITEPLEGLSNGQAEPISASHTFTITFAGEGESQAILGKVDAASGQMSGTLSARWHTRRYGLCSTGHVSWTAQRRASPPTTAAIATVGRYRGWTNQSGHISLDVSTAGRQLTGLTFSAIYRCPGRHSVHLSESFLSPTEPSQLEAFGTFTVNLGGPSYSGRVDGAFGIGSAGAAFGTLEATAITRFGRCRTGVVPWTT